MDEFRFNQLLQRFPGLHLLVVGDFFLDKYLSIEPALSEISLETGLEAYQVVEVRHSPGAAGTVVANLRALEVQVLVVGVIGRDGEGFELKQGLQQRGINIAALIETSTRFTPTYTKPVLRPTEPGGAERELNRLDIKNRTPLPEELEGVIIAHLERLVPVVDGVIIADQVQERNCGIITDRVRSALSRLAAAYPAKIFVVDSRVRIGEFEGVIVKPNLPEARAAVKTGRWAAGRGDIFEPAAELALARSYGQALFQKNQKPVFVTLGAQGVLVVTEDRVDHILGLPVTGEIDTVGAGDSVMASLATTLCAGGTAQEAALMGNLAASITIQQLGTTGTASREQLRHRFEEMRRGGRTF
jgi:rfaE bifunctional protein kinase chain/domain